MNLTRRKFMGGLAAGAVGAAGLLSNRKLVLALTSRDPAPVLVWINDGGGDLNHLALLGNSVPSFLDLVLDQWDVREYGSVLPLDHQSSAEPQFNVAPILILESLPGSGQPDGPIVDKVRRVLPQAKAAILLGTDACFGGVGVDPASIAWFEAQCKKDKTPLIKLPGVPVPPRHLLGTLNHLEYYGFPRLDGLLRPLLYYGETVCQRCEHRDELETGRFAVEYGTEGCLLRLGCKGPITHNSCSAEKWNGGENWCVGAGGPCTGCSEPGFPDHGGLGLYGRLSGGPLDEHSTLLRHVEAVGLGLTGLAGAGIALRILTRATTGPGAEEQVNNSPGNS